MYLVWDSQNLYSKWTQKRSKADRKVLQMSFPGTNLWQSATDVAHLIIFNFSWFLTCFVKERIFCLANLDGLLDVLLKDFCFYDGAINFHNWSIFLLNIPSWGLQYVACAKDWPGLHKLIGKNSCENTVLLSDIPIAIGQISSVPNNTMGVIQLINPCFYWADCVCSGKRTQSGSTLEHHQFSGLLFFSFPKSFSMKSYKTFAVLPGLVHCYLWTIYLSS